MPLTNDSPAGRVSLIANPLPLNGEFSATRRKVTRSPIRTTVAGFGSLMLAKPTQEIAHGGVWRTRYALLNSQSVGVWQSSVRMR